MLRSNFEHIVISRQYGFRHWLTERFLNEQAFPEDLTFIVLIRSPFNWLRSIHRNPWHAAHHLRNVGFSEFIRSEWHCIWDDVALEDESDTRWMEEMMHERNPLDGHRRFRNIMEVRRVKYALWNERLSGLETYFPTSHEAFSRDPAPLLRSLDGKPALTARTIRIPKGYKGRLSWKRRIAVTLSAGLIGRFREKRRTPISLEDIDYIRSHLDADQEAAWGYDLDALTREEIAFTRQHNGGGMRRAQGS